MDNIFLPPACFPGGIKSKFMKTDIRGMNQALFSSLALREYIEEGDVSGLRMKDISHWNKSLQWFFLNENALNKIRKIVKKHAMDINHLSISKLTPQNCMISF